LVSRPASTNVSTTHEGKTVSQDLLAVDPSQEQPDIALNLTLQQMQNVCKDPAVTEPVDTSGRLDEDRLPSPPRVETPPAHPAPLPPEERLELPAGEETNMDGDMIKFCSNAYTSLDSSAIPASSVPWWHNSREALALMEQHEGHSTVRRDKSVVTEEAMANVLAAFAKKSKAGDITGTDGVLCRSSRDSAAAAAEEEERRHTARLRQPILVSRSQQQASSRNLPFVVTRILCMRSARKRLHVKKFITHRHLNWWHCWVAGGMAKAPDTL